MDPKPPPASGLLRPSSLSRRGSRDFSSLSRPARCRAWRLHCSCSSTSFQVTDLPMPASQHQSPKSDIEIAQAAKKRPILDIAREKLGITPENLEPFGHYKAKLSMDYIKSLQSKPNGKLILVTAITPPPAGEGKTTTTVGLTDALNHIGKKAMLCLREP